MRLGRLAGYMTDHADGEETSAYRCESCGREFESEEALEEHLYSVGLVH